MSILGLQTQNLITSNSLPVVVRIPSAIGDTWLSLLEFIQGPWPFTPVPGTLVTVASWVFLGVCGARWVKVHGELQNGP
jgi:hypothetical protein